MFLKKRLCQRHLLKLCMRIPPISAYLSVCSLLFGYNPALILMVPIFSVMFAVRLRVLPSWRQERRRRPRWHLPCTPSTHDKPVQPGSSRIDDPRGYLLTTVFRPVGFACPGHEPLIRHERSPRDLGTGLMYPSSKDSSPTEILAGDEQYAFPSDKNSDDASDDNTAQIVHSDCSTQVARDVAPLCRAAR